MDGAKIYGLCIERLRHQIRKAKDNYDADQAGPNRTVLLESYLTGDIEEIIDILEIYDLGEHTRENLMVKLSDLAFTVSLLAREILSFGFTDEGQLGIYVLLGDADQGRRKDGEPQISEIVSGR